RIYASDTSCESEEEGRDAAVEAVSAAAELHEAGELTAPTEFCTLVEAGAPGEWRDNPARTIVVTPCERPALSFETVSARAGVFSYSGIAPHEDHLPVLERDDCSSASSALREGGFCGTATLAGEDGLVSVEAVPAAGFAETDALTADDFARAAEPGPSATDVGSAFHRLGQLAVESLTRNGRLVVPSEFSIDAIARRYGIEGVARERLDSALARWFESDVARRVETFDCVRAEVPFMVQVGGASRSASLFMEGEIDLLAESDDGSQAFVVDYKTGGSPDETDERLAQKHRLQATCYAYALFATRKYVRVDFVFVRVEQVDCERPDQPQTVHYGFTRDDFDLLEEAIVDAYESASL
ncbi:MAG: PD-(D/E)XK nuclease family protein, partial [Eggerthellaceae bacterium]|nr:PD-(D/E)XK nuclease family protein [Eggerthellaceae bacterium]